MVACARPTATPPPTGASASPAVAAAPADPGLVLATTTSTQDSGLLDVLIPLFEQQTGYRVKTVSVGTGAALALGARGEADVVLVHAPVAEVKWMTDGNGTKRLLVMHNDFVLVGPPDDPAGLKGTTSVVDAFAAIQAKRAAWISRDDDSGTDQLEKQLWKSAGIDPKGESWYRASGQGMGATLTLADQLNAYTISDRATYLARKSSIQEAILLEGDPSLFNVYHVMPVNAAKFPGVRINAAGGEAFAQFIVSPSTQSVVRGFGLDRYGEALFVPDAGKAEDALGH